MLIQGDVLAVIAFLVGTCFSSWCLTLAYGLLFPNKSQIAKLEVTNKPVKCIFRGLLVVLTLGLIGFLLVAQVPNPVMKLVGWIDMLAIFTIGALGMAGIAFHASDRLLTMAPEMNPYAAFTRGAGFLIIGCIVPVVGWFAFGPLLYLAAIGAGTKAVFTRSEEPAVSGTPELAS